MLDWCDLYQLDFVDEVRRMTTTRKRGEMQLLFHRDDCDVVVVGRRHLVHLHLRRLKQSYLVVDYYCCFATWFIQSQNSLCG